MPKPEDFHCSGCETHFYLHKGGKNLPCDWCIRHADEICLWGSLFASRRQS